MSTPWRTFADAVLAVPHEQRRTCANALRTLGLAIEGADPVRCWGLIDAACLLERADLVKRNAESE